MPRRRNVPRAVVGYVRVSTDRQGVSLEAQEARIRAYCERNGLLLREVLSDQMTGSRADRPGLEQIVAGVRASDIGTMIVTKLDRAFRSLLDAVTYDAEFDRHGAQIVATDEHYDSSTPAGRFQKHVRYSVAELERGMIAERTRDALDRKREDRRVYCGVAPFGWSHVDGRVVRHNDEQLVLAEMRTWRADGMAYHRIAEALNERGVLPHRAAAWSGPSVRACLLSKIANEAA